MRNTFFEHYRLSQDEFNSLWNECLFCFDTNVLLDVYRYTPDTRERLLTVLDRLQDRIWIPYQVGKEFHKCRLAEILAQEVPYDQIVSKVNKAMEDLRKELEKLSLEGKKPHPFIDINEIYGLLDDTVAQTETVLQKVRESHPSLLQDDPLLERISKLFDGKVGEPYEQDELNQKYEEIKVRYEYEVPPGYEDLKSKEPPVEGLENPRAYGDAIVWYQVLDFAEQQKKPVILVTGDAKEDWWLRIAGKTIGPRPELIKEMMQKTGVAYYQYLPDRFLERAEDHLKIESEQQAIDEIRDLRLQDEASPAAQALLFAETLSNLARSQVQLENQEKKLSEFMHWIGKSDRFIDPDQAMQLSQAVKSVALKLSRVSGRNEYGGVYGELYRKFGITSYKQLPAEEFDEAMKWLAEWLDDLNGDHSFSKVPAPQ